ncbi:alpha/beta hydrolase [Modestobacter muralis]|uniref:Alpha/beta hydrolase n=1 Tax=Modestobacter muralis TaxID=1608614 RepID=A0A6P0ENL5_9ACTN|nr:alpha/beta hydrolase [Modestobacter muralis]NEK92637.1 alpha/beta hydrolase [Modestobacter muralis]NEN49404.1 alpha/beta hydrolase [Modestobacter muralis]
MSSLEVNGVPTPVWVPGLGLDARSSARVRDLVGGRVVLLPGTGRRGPVGPLAELTAQLQAGLGPGPVVLVGHSQSCQVVAAVAERDPRVAAVLLLGPTTDPRMLRRRVLAGRWLRTALGEPWWQVPLLLSQWLQTGPPAMTALWHRIAADPVDERLRRVRVPVVVVRGSRDALCPHDWAVHLAGCAPRGRLVELPGAGHMLPHTRPAELAALVRELQAPS